MKLWGQRIAFLETRAAWVANPVEFTQDNIDNFKLLYKQSLKTFKSTKMTATDVIKAIQTKVGVDDDGKPGHDTWQAIYSSITGTPANRKDFKPFIIAVQNALGIPVNGAADDNTWAAIAANLGINTGDSNAGNAPPPPVNSDDSPVDARSEGVIADLLPQVQPLARTLVHHAAAAGITIKVISGLRTYDEQDALFAQGRTTPGHIVTNARGGFSNHNFGLAFDIGIFEGGNYIEESPKYKTVGALGIAIGLAWGGNWVSIQDEPHFELRPDWASDLSESDMLAGLRQRKADDQDLLA